MPDTLTRADVAAAIEANSTEFWRAVCGHIAGAEFHDGAGAAWFITGVPFFPFNQVLRVSFAPGSAEAAIDDLLDKFRARDVPFCWNVAPASHPADLGARLQARHPERTGGMPAMALDLSSQVEIPALPDGVAIERVSDAAALDRWAIAYRDGFGLSPDFVTAIHRVYADIGFADSTPFRHFVALRNGQPVACSTMFFHGGVASLWHIGTLPDARRRGIGAAITVAPLLEAHDLGCRTAILFASEMGAPVYRRLGFRERFRVDQYGWGEAL